MEENLQHKISESNLSSLGKAAGIIVGEVALLSTAVEVGSKLEKKVQSPMLIPVFQEKQIKFLALLIKQRKRN